MEENGMKMRIEKHMVGWFLLACILFAGLLFAQDAEIRPVSVGQSMPDFTLNKYQGGEWTLSQLQGKHIMLIFPRGLAGEDHWCHICNYQYAELVDLEKKQKIRKKHDLEIVYVLPYDKSMINEWMDKFPEQLADIENWKNPEDPENLDARGKRLMTIAKQALPHRYMYEKGKVPTPFPILMDEERVVSKGLGIFAEEWSGSKIDQNVPTVFLIDKKGVVQLKYFSQNTLDRPGFEYLMRFVERMMD